MKKRQGKPPVFAECKCGVKFGSKYAFKKHQPYCSGLRMTPERDDYAGWLGRGKPLTFGECLALNGLDPYPFEADGPCPDTLDLFGVDDASPHD